MEGWSRMKAERELFSVAVGVYCIRRGLHALELGGVVTVVIVVLTSRRVFTRRGRRRTYSVI